MGSSVILPAPGQPTRGADPTFKSGAIPTSATFSFANLVPPTALYVAPDDQLDLVGISSVANEVVGFRVRFLHVSLPVPGQPDNSPAQTIPVVASVPPYIGIYDFVVPITALRTNTFIRPNLGEGFILSIFAYSTLATTRGQTFARAAILRGATASGTTHNVVIVSDYVSSLYSVSGPQATLHHYLEGPGFLHSLQQGNPAAGADWTLTVLAHQRLRVVSVNAVLTTAVAVANRNVQFIVDDGANVVGVFGASASIAASLTANVTGTSGSVQTAAIATDLMIPLPQPLILPPGWRVRSSTVGIQGADQWSAIWFNVEEWLDF